MLISIQSSTMVIMPKTSEVAESTRHGNMTAFPLGNYPGISCHAILCLTHSFIQSSGRPDTATFPNCKLFTTTLFIMGKILLEQSNNVSLQHSGKTSHSGNAS